MKIIRISLLVVLAALVASCYPEEYDEDFDFGGRNYYLLPDTLPVLSDGESYEKSEEEIELDAAILEEIAHQMDSAGYTRLTEADTTDEQKMNSAVVLLVNRSTDRYTEYYYDYYNYGYNYYGNYYGLNYYYPGYNYNYYYPWGYPVAYSYAVGTVIIELIDPLDPFEVGLEDNEVSYTVRWMAIMNGLAEMSSANTEQRITDGIRQAFRQSPYLY